jgi:hypothetical protein
MRSLRVAIAGAIIACSLSPVVAHAAPAATVGMHLASQTPYVPLHGTFEMALHIDNPKLVQNPSASIAIGIHESASTRNGFDQVIANQDLGNLLDQVDKLPVAGLPTRGGNVLVHLGLSGSDAANRIAISRPGVYPVEVTLVDTGVSPPPTSFVTWLVVVDNSAEPLSKRLLVAPVWQLTTSPATLPDGTTDPAVLAQLKPGGRIDRIATLLEKSAGMPVSVLANPETVESWSKLVGRNSSIGPGLTRVRAAARRDTTELLPTSYVPIDQPAFEAAGFGDRLPDEIVTGTHTLESTLGATPFTHAQTAFVDPADDASIDRLRQMLVTRVAVRDTALTPAIHQFTPAQAFQLATNTGSVQAVSTAPFIERLLDGHDPAALKAQRVIAALAEVAYEAPGLSRGVVIAPPSNFRPDAAWTTVADALRKLPLVRPVTLDTLFSEISTEKANGADVTRRLQPAAPVATPLTPSEYDSTSAHLQAYAGVAGANDPFYQQATHLLALTLSTAITSDRAHETINRINAGIDGFAAAVTVDSKRITLTSRTATIPLSFENKLKPARTIKVRVHLESSKLVFPKGADQVIELQPGVTTLRDPFAVEARTSGTFPMQIELTSTDGQLHFGQPVRVTVRSAVFGGFAVALTIAALVFLAGWWANHIRRARRARKVEVSAAN